MHFCVCELISTAEIEMKRFDFISACQRSFQWLESKSRGQSAEVQLKLEIEIEALNSHILK